MNGNLWGRNGSTNSPENLCINVVRERDPSDCKTLVYVDLYHYLLKDD